MRDTIAESGAEVPSPPAIELFGRLKMDTDAARQFAEAAVETAAIIGQMRKVLPKAKLGDVKPKPALNPDGIEAAVNAIEESCARRGVKGREFLRLDVEWDLLEQRASAHGPK